MLPKLVMRERTCESKKNPATLYELCHSLLTPDPQQRITLKQVLDHEALATARQTLEPQFKNQSKQLSSIGN
jgi:serine/threonine protein kinase